jgi:3-oxosteroid 1-dehydrogenase
LGADPDGLVKTVVQYNSFAREGIDQEFQKGSDEYQRHLGDLELPAPNLGPIEKPPFYGIRLHPGVIGTACGLKTDKFARVLRPDASVVPGLYACGNDIASIMRGTYPGPGITLGPAMTFGFIAAMHASDGG